MAQDQTKQTLAWAAQTTRIAVEEAAVASERGVIEVGRALGSLVQESRSQNDDLLLILPRLDAEEGNNSVREAIERQTATVTRFVHELSARADRQTQLAEHATRLTESIALLARDVASIAVKARLLSLNARIECSRLGESGRAMTVVATEIRQVSASVAKANADIGELAGELNDLLPSVARLSNELLQTSGDFRSSFAESQSATQATYDELMSVVKSTMARSQNRSERITSEAQNALSALNFQDPMVQSLRELAALIEARCTGSQGADIRLGTREETGDESAAVRTGEVALF